MTIRHNLPSNLNPQGGICHPIFIPDDDDYRRLVLGAIRQLTEPEYYEEYSYALADVEAVVNIFREQTLVPFVQSLSDGTGCSQGGVTLANIGDIQIISHANIPSDFLACDGSEISRTTYADLFNLIGTTYGTGDGSTTFNIPDLRGRTAIGTGTGTGLTGRSLGDTVGEETHQLSVSEMPSHQHSEVVYEGGSQSFGAGQYASVYSREQGTNRSSTDHIQTTGGDAPHNNIQPSLALTYIIKVQ